MPGLLESAGPAPSCDRATLTPKCRGKLRLGQPKSLSCGHQSTSAARTLNGYGAWLLASCEGRSRPRLPLCNCLKCFPAHFHLLKCLASSPTSAGKLFRSDLDRFVLSRSWQNSVSKKTGNDITVKVVDDTDTPHLAIVRQRRNIPCESRPVSFSTDPTRWISRESFRQRDPARRGVQQFRRTSF